MQDKLTAGPSQPYGIWFYSKTSVLRTGRKFLDACIGNE